ncbi:MAG: ABC transporter permease subunit [Streptosporangiales bacterium]|nr:ABC transporter permease subunit [Streptosporangiales bacterium]
MATTTTRPARAFLAGMSRPTKVACAILACFVLTAVVGPMLRPFDSVTTRLGDRLLPPGARLADGMFAPFGTDQLGRDLLAEVLAGSRISLLVALAVVVIGGLLGLVLGLVAGYFGGPPDAVISRLGDIQLAFPSILLAILLAGVLGPGLANIVIALAVTRWVVFARVVRASAISVRNLDFVDSARLLGAGHLRIIWSYILPSCWAPLFVAATAQIGLTMVAEAALSFLGLGVPVSQASWGATISEGRNYLGSAWWISTIPGTALAIVVICVGIAGDALRNVADPQGRS